MQLEGVKSEPPDVHGGRKQEKNKQKQKQKLETSLLPVVIIHAHTVAIRMLCE